MNTQIKNLDLNKIIAVDIETVRGSEHFDENHPNYDIWAWKQRDKKTNTIPDSSEVIASYYNESALSPEWGKIVCISVAYINKDKIVCKSFTGEEKEILKQFIQTVKKTGRTMALHNADFDLPYIRKRYFINSLPPEDFYAHTDVGIKSWDVEKFAIDTMKLWKGINFQNTSLDELAMVFNIPSPKGDMHGNEVGDYYYSGRIADIAKYCEGDVATVLNVILRWRGENILEWESKTEVEVKVEGNLFQRLYQTKDFNAEIKSEFLAQIKAKKMKKTEIPTLKELLKASYLEKIPLMGAEKKQLEEINKERLAELEEFFKHSKL